MKVLREVFEIHTNGKGNYLISIGIGRLFPAKDLQEVIYAMEHYFQKAAPGYSKEPFDYQKHLEHQKICNCCPLCRERK